LFLSSPEKHLKSRELRWVPTIPLKTHRARPASPALLRIHKMGKIWGKLEESFNKKNKFSQI